MQIDLSRFVEALDLDFATALAEIESGRKRSHWMWYVFPQLTQLGRSETARHYGIRDRDEAVAFLAEPSLGADYRRIVAAVWHQVVELDVRIHDLFGSPDDVKPVSSLTLFRGVALLAGPNGGDDHEFVGIAEDILTRAVEQGLPPCLVTQAELIG